VGVTRYLADKSALARLHLPAVREELEPLIVRALVGICGITELEMLFSARNIQERARMKEQLAASLEHVDTPEDIWDQAAETQEALTEQAQHRSASIPDLLVAATARACGLEILHYDRDFDTIARYTEQPARWIVPPGTVLSPLVIPVVSLILIAELLVIPELVGLGSHAEFKRAPGSCGRPLEPVDVAPLKKAEQSGLRLRDRLPSYRHPYLLEVNRTYVPTIR
jgi:predicted nucleic acid-binding protein